MSDEGKNGSAESESTEIELFVLEKQKIRTVHGEEIQVPPLTWGKEFEISKLINSVLGVLVRTGVFSGKPPTEDQIPEVLNVIFCEAPDAITKAMAVLLGKDEKWVKENLISEEIMRLLIPFLKSKQESLAMAIQRYSGSLQQLGIPIQ